MMKRGFSYILAAVVSTSLFWSCVDDATHVLESEYDICFDVAIGNVTKSDIAPNVYPVDVPFKLWTYQKSEGEQCIIDGEQVHYDGRFWRTDQSHLWPDSSLLLFSALSPAEQNASFSLEKGVVYEGFDLRTDDPFICTSSVEEFSRPQTDEPVSLLFFSPLCRVEFSAFSSAAEDVDLWITGIELVGLNMTGDFTSLPEFCWSGLSDTEDLVFFDGRLKLSEDVVSVGSVIDVIPQDLRIKVEYEYKIPLTGEIRYGKSIVSPGNHMRPGCGKWRPYVLKISTEYVEIQKPKKYEE